MGLVSLVTYQMDTNVLVLSRTLYFLPREDNSSMRKREQTVRGGVRHPHPFPLAPTPFSPGGLFTDWVKRPF